MNAFKRFNKPMTFDLVMTYLWLTAGAVLSWFWQNVIPWLTFMSLYAIVVGHWGAHQAKCAEKKIDANG